MFAGLSGAFGYPPPIHQRPIVLEDGRWFAAGSTHGTVEVWNVPERRRILEFGHYRGRVAPVQFSPDGTRLIVLDQGSRLMLAGDRTRHAVGVWDVATQLELVRLEAEGMHFRLGVSSDGNVLVAGVV